MSVPEEQNQAWMVLNTDDVRIEVEVNVVAEDEAVDAVEITEGGEGSEGSEDE